MEVVYRDTDITLPDGGIFSRKIMANGEERSRIKYPYGLTMSRTVASSWSPGVQKSPWQDPHFHAGLTERYFVLSGWVWFISSDRGHLSIYRLKEGDTIVFLPGVEHAVLMGPSAIMSTLLQGTQVGNPERKRNDWWPAVNPALFETEMAGVERGLDFRACLG